MVEDLKNKKDENGISVYDNSLIIAWGDHNDHSHPVNNTSDYIDRSNSNLLIKFPHEVKNQITIVKDKLVWGPQINFFINDYFGSAQKPKTLEEYLNDPKYSPYFNISRKFYTALYDHNSNDENKKLLFYPTKYDPSYHKNDNHIGGLVEDLSRQKIFLDINSSAPSEKVLNEMYEGVPGGVRDE